MGVYIALQVCKYYYYYLFRCQPSRLHCKRDNGPNNLSIGFHAPLESLQFTPIPYTLGLTS